MKILYGVQATGQGHISRARAMAEAFRRFPEIEVTWLFSGRQRDRLFDMEPFGDFLHRDGLSFSTRSGKISHLATLVNNNVFRLLMDIRSLDVSRYDLVVTDFEPVTAWAARLAGKTSVGIGHQYAFGDDTPRVGDHFIARMIMKWFAPVDIPLGLHWYPYADNIVPPILDLPDLSIQRDDYVLVYLPFEDQDVVTQWLNRCPEVQFVQYAAGLEQGRRENVERHPASIRQFKDHLASASGVICNSGFELISECLYLNKPVLTKPLSGQFEQLSNALALQQLGYATITEDLSLSTLKSWLQRPLEPPPIRFPDVPARLADWLAKQASGPIADMAEDLWRGLPGGAGGSRITDAVSTSDLRPGSGGTAAQASTHTW